MDTVIFGDYTVQHLLYAGGAVVALIVVISIFKALFRKKPESPHHQRVTCSNCGWQGQVSKYAGRCPKCNAALGDQLAKRRP